jgi:hypothetical protein
VKPGADLDLGFDPRIADANVHSCDHPAQLSVLTLQSQAGKAERWRRLVGCSNTPRPPQKAASFFKTCRHHHPRLSCGALREQWPRMIGTRQSKSGHDPINGSV